VGQPDARALRARETLLEEQARNEEAKFKARAPRARAPAEAGEPPPRRASRGKEWVRQPALYAESETPLYK